MFPSHFYFTRAGLLALLACCLLQASAAFAQTNYSTILSAASGKCIDVEAGGWNTGARIIQYACHNGDNQQWTLVAANGAYQIVGKRLGQCITPAGGSALAGTAMQQLACGAYANQAWSLQFSGGSVRLLGQQTGMCLAVENGSLQDVAQLVQQPCQGVASELWNFSNPAVLPPAPPSSATLTTLVASHSSKCLTIAGSQTAAGSPATQATCNGSAAQQWKVAVSGDAYTIALNSSGLCLGIEGASQTPAAAAVLMACNGATNTLWTTRQVGATAMLVARHSGQCLDIYGSSWSDGAAAIQYTCAGSANQLWTLNAPPLPGTTLPTVWSPLISFPIVPVAAANLPNGKVLTWSAYAPDNFGDDNAWGRTYTALFDPATQSVEARVVSETGHDMFCPGTTLLPDGRLLVNGGSSSQKTSIYNPAGNAWNTGPLMNIPRGYQGNTLLANGSVLTLGGSWSGGEGGKIGEVWSASGGWKRMSGIPIDPFIGPDPGGVFRGDNHLWLFPFSNGRVFHAGPSAAMHWITTGGNGSVTNAGNRNDDDYSMNGNAVMVDIGKILKTGGAPAYEDVNATPSAYLIDLNALTTRKLAPMNYARAMHNSVVLPNGQVVISGGQTYVKIFSDDSSVLMTELWDPKTETFTRLSAMQAPRNYHSLSLLLPDGRVLIGGGLCGSCTTNHFDAQILTPPYLLNADGSPAARPAILNAPAGGAPGGTLTVSTDSAVSAFALMRLSAVTHSLNNDQRRIPLQVTAQSGNSYTLALPADRGIMLPGYYMLFALNAAGVPSLSKTVQIR